MADRIRINKIDVNARQIAVGILLVAVCIFSACKRGGSSSIFGQADETPDAAVIVAEANKELAKIKVLYKDNEDKREELKNAMAADDETKVKKIAEDVMFAISDGGESVVVAIEKLETAQDMHINADYKEYLRLKVEALKKQKEAFEEYRQAARSLRDNYDPKNTQLRDKVKVEFKERSENYQKIMEKARDYSNEANELAKDAMRKPKA